MLRDESWAMERRQHQRRRGACLQCARKKRKCDHKRPQCTQCMKHGQQCQLQTFKVSTLSIISQEKSQHSSSPEIQNSRTGAQKPASPIVGNSGIRSATSPVTQHQHDAAAMSSLDIVTGIPGPPGIGDSGVLESLLRSEESESSHENAGFLSPGAMSTAPLLTPNQITFGDAVPEQDPIPAMEMGDEPFMDLLPLDIGDIGIDVGSRATMIPEGEEIADLVPGGGTMFKPYPNLTHDFVYCPMPWPADMLASPDRRFLWQYFLQIAEADFLCLDWDEVGHLYDFQHPYITTLPQMALANDALRAAVFCFAATQYRLRLGGREFEKTRALTGSEAAMALSTQTAHNTDDSDLLSLISAATLLHSFGTERGDYLRFASRLVSQYLSRPKAARLSTTAFPEVPLTEFRWAVISTLCSLYQPSAPLDDNVCRMIEMSQKEIEKNYSQAFQRWVSHPIYTFSPRLVNPLLRIGRLLESQLLQLEQLDVQIDPSWATRVSEAEDMLLQARDCDMNVSRSALGSADPAAVIALNESMYAAGAILVYARLHGMPPTAPFIRRQTQIVSEEIAKVPSSSHVSFSMVFPLFIAGCEAVEQHIRDAILKRLGEVGGVIYVRGDLEGALNHIWGIRDLEPGLPWPHWARKLEPRYRISCLI